jgi:fumarate hydratase class I
MEEVRAILSALSVGTRLMLKGTMIVARDIAHARIKDMLQRGEALPDYFRKHPIYYAGPAKTPPGYASGSFGPTTSTRMDPYVSILQSRGGSLVMIGKGNRTKEVVDSCKRYGGFYLGSIGGASARIGKECIKEMELVAFPELGMEAIWRIRVDGFPAFLIIDDKGNDFYQDVLTD